MHRCLAIREAGERLAIPCQAADSDMKQTPCERQIMATRQIDWVNNFWKALRRNRLSAVGELEQPCGVFPAHPVHIRLAQTGFGHLLEIALGFEQRVVGA